MMAAPWYNGVAEAGIGNFKARASYQAIRCGRPGEWTCEDVEAARIISNHLPRARTREPLSAQQLWHARVPLSSSERQESARAINTSRLRAFDHYGLSPEAELTARQNDNVNRFAVSRALVARGYLSFTRRRITPPFKSIFCDNIR